MKKLEPLTEKELGTLKYCASRGLRWEDIARIIGRSQASIERDDIALETYRVGRAQAKLKVANTFFTMATSGKHPVMTIFACKVMLGFSEDGDAFREREDNAKRLNIPGAHFGKVTAADD